MSCLSDPPPSGTQSSLFAGVNSRRLWSKVCLARSKPFVLAPRPYMSVKRFDEGALGGPAGKSRGTRRRMRSSDCRKYIHTSILPSSASRAGALALALIVAAPARPRPEALRAPPAWLEALREAWLGGADDMLSTNCSICWSETFHDALPSPPAVDVPPWRSRSCVRLSIESRESSSTPAKRTVLTLPPSVLLRATASAAAPGRVGRLLAARTRGLGTSGAAESTGASGGLPLTSTSIRSSGTCHHLLLGAASESSSESSSSSSRSPSLLNDMGRTPRGGRSARVEAA
mmetsp:Transcript_70142/g.199007  ORF Transcript_70142/g.199007 Transcript_70142/m.199007 type:complete len:288 (-) Transcript_70142:8-871(-)